MLMVAFIISIITSIISTFYYLRVVKVASFSVKSEELTYSNEATPSIGFYLAQMLALFLLA